MTSGNGFVTLLNDSQDTLFESDQQNCDTCDSCDNCYDCDYNCEESP